MSPHDPIAVALTSQTQFMSLGLPQVLDSMKGLLDNVNRAVFSLVTLVVSSSILTVSTSPPAAVGAQYLLGLGMFSSMRNIGVYNFFLFQVSAM